MSEQYEVGELLEGLTWYSKSRVRGEFVTVADDGDITVRITEVLQDQTRDPGGIVIGANWDLSPESVARVNLKAPALMSEEGPWDTSSDTVPAPEDVVNHPSHYTSHPSGIECITITQHMSFTLGNAIKYIWRADLKSDAIEDLKKARFYLDREIEMREAQA